MFENLNPEIRKILESRKVLISSFSTESKLNILETAKTGNLKALKQEIEFVNLGGDY